MTKGGWVAAIGGFHCLVILIMGWEPLVAIVADGVVGAVPDDEPLRMAAFWSQFFGLVLAVLGATWHALERQQLAIPRSSAVGLFLVGLAGVVVMPISGFWLVLPVAALAARR